MNTTTNSDSDGRSGMGGLVDKMQDAVGGMVGMASASTAGSHNAEAFVTNATIGDLYEIQAAALAVERSRSPEIRTFATMMAQHHTTSMHQLQSALHSHETHMTSEPLIPPTALDNRRQGMIEHLAGAPEDDFDKRYLAQQTMAHQETLTLLKGYGESGDNPQLASYARAGSPMVERHLKMLKQISPGDAEHAGGMA